MRFLGCLTLTVSLLFAFPDAAQTYPGKARVIDGDTTALGVTVFRLIALALPKVASQADEPRRSGCAVILPGGKAPRCTACRSARLRSRGGHATVSAMSRHFTADWPACAPLVGGQMATLLIHITAGPNDPTKAALGFLVAKAAQDEGHTVSMFLAGDAVQLIRDNVLDNLAGLGTGKLREHYDAVVTHGTKIHLSGMSCACRGVSDQDLEGKPVEKAMPNVLVQLTMDADKVLTY